ncbi:MAG: phosphopentomutase, partial [Gammaproteobacteria bacterium]|nr:phosphopentomutase [Gammaproteobacteria bacterium]
MRRAIILVLDSFGIGAPDDAVRYGDAGADTLGSIARTASAAAETGERGGPLALPNLARLGLMHAAEASTGAVPAGCALPDSVDGAWCYAKELSSGKDTPSGHWEIAGVPVLFDWGYFTERENTFPPELLDALIRRGGLPGVLGNCHASGTEIIARLGEEHRATGKPIVYTSADSVFQIAAHEESFGLERLLELSEIARELVDEYRIGRVIARPFVGDDAASFQRTGNRRDYTTPPHAPTVLD